MTKQKNFFGYTSIRKIEEILEEENVKKVFLVTGKTSFKISGAEDLLKDILSKYSVFRFSNFSPNTKIEEIENGLREFETDEFDIIIAVGGGSVIDIAKAIKSFYFEKNRKNIPLVAVPTTAGSGSEATYFIVYYKGKHKISAGKKELTLPEYSICDPSLIESLPKKIKATSAMDALCQAVESYWSVNSNELSKKFSKKAIQLIIKNIKQSIFMNDRESNNNLMLGSNLAGKAINITKTTACHALSYSLTSYFGIPHGHAVSLTLAEIMEYNSKINEKDCNDKRGVDYVKKTISEITNMLGASGVKDRKIKIRKLMEDIGLETKLSDLNIDKNDLLNLVKKDMYPERMLNNPRFLDEKEIKEIFKKIY